MEKICKVVWNTDHSRTGLGNRGFITSSWSCNNLFAFTTEKKKNGFMKRYFHILNPNQPWEIHSGESKVGDVVCLEWDPLGSRLLVVDSVGSCAVWSMNTYLTNSWAQKSELVIDIKGEEVIKASWFHNGSKFMFYADKFDSTHVEDKLKRETFKPTLSQPGGQSVDGYIVVTKSGMVVVNVIHHDSNTTKLTAQLDVQNSLVIADIAFHSDGHFIIMATDGIIANAVQFWSVNISYDTNSGRLKMMVDNMPSLKSINAQNTSSYTTISHAKFVNKSQSNHVFICLSGPNGSKFESWLYKKSSSQLHKLFSVSTPSNGADNFDWQYVTSSNDLPQVLSFSVPPLPIHASSADSKAASEGNFYCGFGIMVALEDRSIKILHRLTLNEHLSVNVADHQQINQQSRKRSNAHFQPTSVIKHIVYSETSCAVIALDNEGSLILYKVAPWLSTPGIAGTAKALKHLTHLLHYCLITGFDWWDILLHLNNPALPEQICLQLNTEFQQYSMALQEMLHSRHQSMNITIYQSTWHPKATDCHVRLLVKTIAVVFRSVLKASDSSTSDIEADDKLTELCSTSQETNILNLIQVIENPIPSMQPLIQWIVDISLYLLANIPLFSQQVSTIPGFSLIMDKEWLGTLREMLINTKSWCLINSKCSPNFICFDDELDPIAHIFMLVTNVWAEASINKDHVVFSNDLVEKCRLLPKLIDIPSLDIIIPSNGIIARLNDLKNHDKPFVFEKKPSKFNTFNKLTNLNFIAQPEETGSIDHLRRLYLGKSPVNKLKQCMRCGILTGLVSTHADPTIKIWDDRFTRTCLCGGKWMRTSGPISYKCD